MSKSNKYKYVSVREKKWVDLQDNKYPYKKGDTYPREGLEVTEERLKELSSNKNKLGEVLIKKVKKNDTEIVKEEIEPNENKEEQQQLEKEE